jgi:hypothetical protein
VRVEVVLARDRKQSCWSQQWAFCLPTGVEGFDLDILPAHLRQAHHPVREVGYCALIHLPDFGKLRQSWCHTHPTLNDVSSLVLRMASIYAYTREQMDEAECRGTRCTLTLLALAASFNLSSPKRARGLCRCVDTVINFSGANLDGHQTNTQVRSCHKAFPYS